MPTDNELPEKGAQTGAPTDGGDGKETLLDESKRQHDVAAEGSSSLLPEIFAAPFYTKTTRGDIALEKPDE